MNREKKKKKRTFSPQQLRECILYKFVHNKLSKKFLKYFNDGN